MGEEVKSKPAQYECWVRACKYNKEGLCTEVQRPTVTGCALTWVFGGGMPQEKGKDRN